VPNHDDDLEITMRMQLAEISGSETYMHVVNDHFDLVLQLSGVISYHIGDSIKVYLPTHKLFVFDPAGNTIQTPSQRSRGK
jgi:glycerol transport system ATP-binding protein